ncbi:MAG TPA: phosphoribosylaminoimidazolesuccinocarboxamide synthase, partial [Trebonia sp.]
MAPDGTPARRGYPGLVQLIHSGKVRDVYADGDDLLLVATDRVSIYDVILPTPVPGKGRVLTQLSLWWFDRLAGIIPNHVISATDVPDEWAGRAIRCQRLEMLPVECIARGYLTGLGLAAYRETGAVSGVPLPPGLTEASKLPEPVFTPTTKAAAGHDEPMTFDEVATLLGPQTAAELRRVTLEVYERGAALAAERGLIVADTKLEFGLTSDGTLVLADEVLTPDSSRFWPAGSYSPGRPQHSFDKQYLRDWSAAAGWDRTPPGPAIPADVLAVLTARYNELFERMTGEPGPA